VRPFIAFACGGSVQSILEKADRIPSAGARICGAADPKSTAPRHAWSCARRPRRASPRPRSAPRRSEDRRLGVAPEDLLQRLHDLALRGVGAGAGEQRLHEVALLVGGVLAQGGERGLHGGGVAAGAHGVQARDLLALERGVDAQRGDGLLPVELVAVDADDDALAGVDLALVSEGGVGDLALGVVALDGGDHAAELVDLVEVLVT